MSGFYDNKLFDIKENKISFKIYADAYYISEIRHGKIKGKEWKASVFFVLWLLSMFYMSVKGFHLSKNPVPVAICVICLYMMTYYLFLLPKKTRLLGEHIYKSSHLLNKTEHIEIFRDHFVMQSRYEKIIGYWTDMSDCIECRDYFLLISEFNSRLMIIPRESVKEEEWKQISDFFMNTFPSKYRKINRKII